MASHMNWEEARDKFQKFREEQIRNSDEVVDMWEVNLADFSYKLGDELWLIYEQVCIAACDCSRFDIAQECLDALRLQFRGSLRVKRLQGLLYEAMGKYEHALQIYNKILDEDETNALVRKRKIAIYKAENKLPDAIKELNKYLEEFMSDHEAWNELCDLYLQELEYGRAAFCMEELLMLNPHNHLFMEKYAEIKYTQGGQENVETSRSYFAQALKLNPNNMRALYGLFMAASNIASYSKVNAKSKRDNVKYAAWAADQISQRYKRKTGSDPTSWGAGSNNVQAVEGMLDSLQITQAT